MRALSVCTFAVFLFVFAAHVSWWKTSVAISSKLSKKPQKIFSGEKSRQIEKLGQLGNINEKMLEKDVTRSISSISDDQLLDSQISLARLRELNQSEEHLLTLFAKRFSNTQNFDEETIDQIIYYKNLPERGPAANALRDTLSKLERDPDLSTENYTDLFFELYETYAFDPNSYQDFYEMRDTLTRLNYEPEEIDEFQEGFYRENPQDY